MGICCNAFDKHWILFSSMWHLLRLSQGRTQGRPKCALGWLQKLTHVPLAIAIILVTLFYTNGNMNEYSTTHCYLMAWWRHKCVISNIIKVYFIELKMNTELHHCLHEKHHFCFDYNSGVSWSLVTGGNRNKYSSEKLTKFITYSTATVSPRCA